MASKNNQYTHAVLVGLSIGIGIGLGLGVPILLGAKRLENGMILGAEKLSTAMIQSAEVRNDGLRWFR